MAFAPTVSIVVPVYNRADLIGETLHALLAQTYRPEPEIVVADDGSTDATPEVLGQFGDRIRVARQDNQGASAARNLALHHATGDYIAFCDSDDLWTPDKLKRQIPLFEAHPRAGFVYGDFRCFDTDADTGRREWTIEKPTPSGFILRALLERNFIVPSTVVVSREALDAAGPFDPACCNAEDYDLFLRLSLRTEAVYDTGLACYYRQHPVSASRVKRQYWEGFLESLYKIRGEIQSLHRAGTLRNPVDGAPIGTGTVRQWDALLRRRIASFHVRLARYWSRKGLGAEAWREASDAFRLAPADPQAWTVLWRAFRQRLGLGKHR